jgi:16S rRNA (uracil1498-N3)-methyltransferase
LIADRAGRALRELVAPRAPAGVAVMIGPEGGWCATEEAAAQAAGWRAARLHQNVLRAETAAMVAATLLLAPTFGDPMPDAPGKLNPEP